MNFKLSLVLFFSVIKVFQSQNVDTIINEKVHLTEEDAENLNSSNDEDSELVVKSQSSFLNSYQQTDQTIGLVEIQQELPDIQTKKTTHYPSRPIFSNSNTISKAKTISAKSRPTMTEDQEFTKLDSQQVSQQFENEMDNGFSAQPTFSNSDSQHQSNGNWPPFDIKSASNNYVTSKPIAGEFTVNSNTLNFTNNGLDNLKIFNISSTNHVLPPITTLTSVTSNANYNQQDKMQIIANPIQNLVLRSFENFRRLIKNCETIESFLITNMNLPKGSKIHTLDPLELPESLYFEHRDLKTPLLGKIKFTLQNVKISGLSTFKTENLSNQGRTLYFKHRIPELEFSANYTVDYYLFDEIPLLISKGHLKATVTNAFIKGVMNVLPDILNVWFKVTNLNLSSSVEDVDVKVYPQFAISDRFRIERTTISRLNAVIKNIMPNIVEYLKLTYSKTIEMKIV